MFRLILFGAAILLLVSGCGTDETPTRHNDFAPLTSVVIVAAAPAIAAHTSTKLSVQGNYSGLFTRDVTDQAIWSSSAPDVAGFVTGASPSRVTGLAPGTATLTATVGSVSTTLQLTVTSATVTSLAITPAAPTVTQGLTAQLMATGTFSDATTQNLTFDSAWTSNDPAVATVGDAGATKGRVQGLSVGTATVTATFGGVAGTTQLTVAPVALASITVSPASATLPSLATESFQAIAHFTDGSSADITSQAAWTSSRTDIATVAADGRVTTLAQGMATISAGLGGVTGSSTLEVTGGNLTGIVLEPQNPTLVKGTVGAITATGSFTNGSSRDITGAVTWSVSNTANATVTTPGGNQALINALGVTSAAFPTSVKAASGAISATTNLTVIAPLLAFVTISPASLDLTTGTSGLLTATATYGDGTTQDVTASADWSSSAPATAPVDTGGLAGGRVHGVAATALPVTITAAFGGKSDTAEVTVRNRTLQGLAISGNPNIGTGNQVPFTATATYTDTSREDVTADATWTIDKPDVAILADSQHQPGQVVGVGSGTATLTAAFGGRTQTVTLTVR